MTTFSIDPQDTIATIRPELHGQFIEFLGSCISDGLWVGPDSPIPNIEGIRTGVVEALAELQPPVVRWPGGCYADTYHWRDGIGPRNTRPVTFNENFGTFETDDHAFGTEEFMRLCHLIGAEPWLNINLLSGTVAEMRDWMEYCNRDRGTALAQERAHNDSPEPYDVRYWGVGNEAWAGGGFMTPSAYADEYRRFASAMPSFKSGLTDSDRLYRIACGPDGNKPMERRRWTQDLLEALSNFRQPSIDALDLHFYNWNIEDPQDTPTSFSREGWDRVIHGALEIEDVIHEQRDLIDEGLTRMPEPESPMDTRLKALDLVVGEWGNWHRSAFTERPALFQQVTMRDAITTALTLDVFHRNADVVKMACVAQTVNVLNSLILTDGPATILTPNYDVFMMYKAHRGATALRVEASEPDPDIHVFASATGSRITVNLVNASMTEPNTVELTLPTGARATSHEVLETTHPQNCNTAEDPDRVRRTDAPLPIVTEGAARIEVSPASIRVLSFTR